MKELTIEEGVTELGVTTVDGEEVIVSSRDVADSFDKRHDHVLRDIRNIKEDVSPQFWGANFERSKYEVRGREYPEFLLSKDGCVFLVMGYEGKKAARFKEAYIEQFNRMEELIQNRYLARNDYAPMTNAIKEFVQSKGKTPKFYHFSNEANMLNRIVLGDTAKKYCEKNDIPRNELRDHLPSWQLQALHRLERLNTDLLHMGLEYDERKSMLKRKFNHIYSNLELPNKEAV